MPEAALLLAGLLAAGAFVLLPLRRDAPLSADDDRDAAVVRHRVALEALRDVEADRRAGSLDEPSYLEQRAEAEARAAVTAAELEAAAASPTQPVTARRGARPMALAIAAVIGLGLVVGSLVPATGLANSTVLDCNRALAQPNGDARAACLDRLRDELAADPRDPATLSALADAYLAGDEPDDLARAVAALQLLIAVEPERADAYERAVAAYLRAGDTVNARRALDSYEGLETADPVELAFLDGLVALRDGDDERAVAAFDRFLELAPDDPRAPMVRRLRDDPAGGEDG